MDTQVTNKKIIEQYFKYFNNYEWQKMADMYIEQPEMKDPAYGIKNIKMTKANIVKKYSELNQIIHDVHDNVINMYYSGDNVIVEFESSGTAPDGSKFVIPICTIFEIKNGKITKDLTYYDNFEEK
ncbi:MAG: nuclear transport factor 2 family protein [Sphingobacteriales bacterium]|nr:MAG: nuclear transport factor 2 family protein [Sphingobacteriales bacterium]TAF83796.1 MAG: nuclear transport factor 2 family protein [Sphingobacteriales bacterium]